MNKGRKGIATKINQVIKINGKGIKFFKQKANLSL